MPFLLPSDIILYNDRVTNDTVTNRMVGPDMSRVTRVAPQSQVYPDKGMFVFVYDPYTKSTFWAGRGGQLIHHYHVEITPEYYRTLWAEVNFGNS
jgi:hypothetical protein